MTDKAQCGSTKSDQIRELHDKGHTIAEIARELNTYYSFVYRVVKRYTDPQVDNRPKSKSQRIRELYNEGKSVDEILAILTEEGVMVDRSHVYGVVKKHRANKSEKDGIVNGQARA